MQNKYPKGQIGLLLLVIMGVVVALVMSISSRSLSDMVISRQERESSAAFAVAETGVERAMNELRLGQETGQKTFQDTSTLITGNYAVTPTTTYGLFVKEGETAHLDLIKSNGALYAGALTITWTKKNDVSEYHNGNCAEGSNAAPAAIEIKAIAGTATPATVKYAYYNPYGCLLGGQNKFLDTASAAASPYLSTVNYVVPADTTMLRIKTIYSGATITVSGVPTLEKQLYLIQSSATGGDVRKDIEVKRGLDAPPSIFDFAIFTGGTIVK